MEKLLGCLGIMVVGFIFVLLVVGGSFLAGYNGIVAQDEAVKTQWAQVDNQLQRRYELIPNLVATTKGLSDQESKIFLGLAEARKGYFSAQNPADKAVAAGNIESALSRLLVFQENYPQLKSNEAFMRLMDSLEGTENRLSVERGRYNDRVRSLNSAIRGFPGSFFAGLAGVTKAEYFKVPEAAKEVPKVDFSNKEKV